MVATAHAVYAPSSAHRWTVCTASAEGIAALGEREEGDEAKEGTEAHEEIERVLGPLHDKIAFDWNAAFALAKTRINFEHEAAYGIALMIDYVRQLPPGVVWIEQRVKMTDQIWGRCDVAHWHAESLTLTIVDYKNGFVNVEAEDNEQLQIYAAGTILSRKLPARFVRLVVVQPNSFMPVPRVKQWSLTADALHARVTPWAAIPSGPKVFVAGASQCRDCPLFGLCPPTKDLIGHLAAALSTPATEVPNDKVALYLTLEKPIEHFFEALRKIGSKRALAGDVPKGMRVVESVKHREWKTELVADLKESIHAEHGLKHFELPTPAQAVKLGLIAPEFVARYANKPAGGPSLAFADDKRPDFKRKSAAEMFAGALEGTK